MKHETAALNTKKTLAASLKKYMARKSLSKITVSEIVADCDLNRKTFYYHFEDIYALLKWTLEQEAVEVVRQFDLLVDYEQAIVFVMDYVEQNAHILSCACDSMGRDGMKRFFYTDFIGIVRTLVDGAERELGVSAPADFKDFLCQLYTEALAGMLIEWVKDRTRHSRGEVLNYLSLIFKTSIPSVLTAAQAAPRGQRPPASQSSAAEAAE